MADRIGVPLELDDFEVLSSEVVGGVLEVEVSSTLPACCYHCGSVDVVGHGRATRRLRDRSAAYPTVLVWSQRRFRCLDCGRTSREQHPAVAGRRRITGRFLHHLGELAIAWPWVEVAVHERVSWWRVASAFDLLSASEVQYSGAPPRVLSLDESAFRRRFRYHTVVSDPEGRGVLDLVEGRDQRAAEEAISRLPHAWLDNIETMVIDCHWPYRKAIEHLLPGVRVVADKFHVLRSIDAAAQKVRVRHGKRRLVVGRDGGLARQHNPRFDPRIWRARWLFMRRRHQLGEVDQQWLEEIFTALPEVGVAWWMKEAFAAIYEASDRAEAQRRLEVWVGNLEAAGLIELHQTWRTLNHWREQILAYFDDRQTNSYAEGITNKIKVIKRRGYGHRNSDRYRHRVLWRVAVDPPGADDPPQFAQSPETDALGPAVSCPPVRRDEFEALVDAALEELPEWVVEVVDNVHVVVEDWPSTDQDDEYGGGGTLLGLYHGVNLHDRAGHYSGAMPDRITIFMGPHLALRLPPSRLKKQIRKTVLHEVAHHLGIDDERLHELGY